MPDRGRRFLRVEARERGQAALLLPHAEGRPFAFAGLWESWDKGGGSRTCAILTTRANSVLEGIHDRMPVILPSGAYDLWLDPDADREQSPTC